MYRQTSAAIATNMSIACVRKHTRSRKLTSRMLNGLIEKIGGYLAEKVNGLYVQRLIIHYNCVGTSDVPQELPIAEPQVLIQTRKGVAA